VNALQFESMLGREVEAPARLFDVYGRELDAAGVQPEATSSEAAA
jgi:hypothetical protein